MILMGAATVNVLIVESDARQTEIAMELVRDVVRAQVDSTSSGERAIELASRTPYQLIIADCNPGDLDGLSLLERVKLLSPTTSVILTSSFASIEEGVKAIRYGADEYFKKPFNPEHFKLAVRRCLDRRALFTGDQSVKGLMLLLNACQLISGYLDEEKILETVTGYLKRETNCEGVALFKMLDGQKIHIPTSSDVDADVVQVLVDGLRIIESAQEEKIAMKVTSRTTTMPEVAVFQFRCVGDLNYFVVCVAPNWTALPEEIDSRFRLLQAQMQMTGRNISNYQGVKHLLYCDEPTGLHNTRYLHVCLDQYFEQRQKKLTDEPMSVLFLDVDKFKSINDSHGHLVGTKLLHEMAEIIRGCIGKNDVAFRYGGDEFVVLLMNTNSPKAREIAEAIRTSVEKNVFLERESLKIRLTVSIGVATCPEHAESKRDIIEAADGAMYNVKRSSRNNVYIAEKKAA